MHWTAWRSSPDRPRVPARRRPGFARLALGHALAGMALAAGEAKPGAAVQVARLAPGHALDGMAGAGARGRAYETEEAHADRRRSTAASLHSPRWPTTSPSGSSSAPSCGSGATR